MNIYDNPLYLEDIKYVASIKLPWDILKDKSILISGATGMIGSFLVDVLMQKNLEENLNCRIYALGRDEKKARQRFDKFFDDPNFVFKRHDINLQLEDVKIDNADYVLHLASNTHPLAYSKDPIGTITTNIIGLKNLLDFASEHETKRFAFASSNEIYGENRGDVEKFDEKYCGYIDCNTMRAGYPESKRCGEALCQAYISQKNLDVVIPRLTRSYGPTLLKTDSKAMSQFLHNAVEGKDIVLKSAGTQYYSYTYVTDAVSGILTVLLCGKTGEAYNIADEQSDIMLKDLAAIIAGSVGKKVIFQIPDSVESAGYSKATKARLDGAKLMSLGWKPKYSIRDGVTRTISILGALD